MKHIEWKIIRKQNESDLITDLLAPNVGLNLFTPVNINDGNDATINSDPHKDTYIERRIDYILPSDALASYGIYGSILNTWSYTAETIPDGLELTDTSDASDHLPVYAVIVIPEPGDMDDDGDVDVADVVLFASHWLDVGCGTENSWCAEADITGDGEVDLKDLTEFAVQWPSVEP